MAQIRGKFHSRVPVSCRHALTAQRNPNTTKSDGPFGPPQVGAVDEIRTRDIHLGKVALYH